jgi:hypothetical protein
MKTENFNQLIQLVTGRDLQVITHDQELIFDHEYMVGRKLPLTGRTICFKWKTPKSDEKILRSFVTAFTSKYKEPNPKSYDYVYAGKQYTWAEKTPEQIEYCYNHHASHMFSKDALLKQVEANFQKESITNGLIRYGFYPTEYGLGIFSFWLTESVMDAIKAMENYLQSKSIPFTNEFSDARWVYRFRLEISKPAHESILSQFQVSAN